VDTARRSAARSERVLLLVLLPRVRPLRQLSASSRQGAGGRGAGGRNVHSSTYTAVMGTVPTPQPQQPFVQPGACSQSYPAHIHFAVAAEGPLPVFYQGGNFQES
jgi:hypothetical protein